MPLVQLITNLKKDAIPEDFSVELSKLAASLFKWPDEQYFMVHILADQDVIRGGQRAPPGVWLDVSICRVSTDPEINRPITTSLMSFVSKNLDLAEDRIAVIIRNLADEGCGLPNGGLVSDLPKV